MQWKTFLAVTLILGGLSGCSSIGPGTLARDRVDYITAISNSWKSQMLLNLVKLRYGDAPVFLDVASVINQYGIEGSLGFSGNWTHNAQAPWPYSALYNWFGTGRYAERPTITYSPLSGEKFARSLMTPIPPAAVLNFLQAGYPVDVVLRLMVHSINGIQSRYGGARMRVADPEFYTLVEKLREVQHSGDIGMRVRRTGEQTSTLVIFSRKPNPTIEAARAEVRKILGLDPKSEEFSVVYGSVAANDKEIAILTRSMLEILIDLASYIEVPAASATERRTFPTPAPEVVNGAPLAPLIRILSSPQIPADAFAAVPYQQDWYWIDDRDLGSKRLFSFIMFLFTLTETGEKQGAPIITIPVG
ncbi:MAG TPA: hypothetical protein VFU31_11710 [Candidatus Binatia bacterium]|nr:hypothetical protein [Candidatus Binatia bacterium]